MSALAALVSAAVASACPATHVHYASYPGVGSGLSAAPWIRTAGVSGSVVFVAVDDF